MNITHSQKQLVSVAQDSIFSFTILDIESITPNTGGMAGGTLVTIKGKGFKVTKDKIKIDIAGKPCEVQSNTADEIVCKTSPAQASDFTGDEYAGTVSV